MPHIVTAALLLVSLGSPVVLHAQDAPETNRPSPQNDVSIGFNYVRANAPPAGCDCFSLLGGYVSGSAHINRWLSFAAEGTAEHATNISALGQNLNLFTLATGPRISYTKKRFVPFGQVLLGVAHATDSYFPEGNTSSPSATSYAITAGGGLDVVLSHRFAVRAINAEYLKTGFPNGTNNSQSHLMLGAGLTLRFGKPPAEPPAPRVTPHSYEISFTCSTDVPSVTQGQTLGVMGHAFTEPDQLSLTFNWSTPGAKIIGIGRQVSVDTSELPPGQYHIHGRATLMNDATTSAECEAPFQVTARPSNTTASVSPTIDKEAADKEFHENVKDALFDYDSYALRSDAQTAVETAAHYLIRNPQIKVEVQGYADERGSAEYNLALGEQRANAARNALIGLGVDPARIKIISFGKEAQVCTQDNEACWQENRRAAFSAKW